MTRVAINGFGRIGRAFLRAAWHEPDIEVVAINDLGSLESLAYLLQYDSVYRQFPAKVEAGVGELVVGAKHIKVFSEKEPAKIPWGSVGVDVVVESTGFFTDFGKAKAHLAAGAKRVVISAPAHDGADEAGAAVAGTTVLMGVNEDLLEGSVLSSNASCTTNAASPLIAILDQGLGIERALLNTTHAYTASQALVDGPSKKDLREGRGASQNIVPEHTGAAIAVTQAYPKLAGRFDGIALRVPVPAGSIADVTFIAKRDTSAQEINKLLTDAAALPQWQGIFAVTTDPIVSSDIIGSTYGSIADLSMTRVIGNLVKVLAWYDNEMGYAHTLVEHVKLAGMALNDPKGFQAHLDKRGYKPKENGAEKLIKGIE